MKFCNNCGRIILEDQEFCDKKCQDAYERKQRPKNRKKYGLTGRTYGTYGTKRKYK